MYICALLRRKRSDQLDVRGNPQVHRTLQQGVAEYFRPCSCEKKEQGTMRIGPHEPGENLEQRNQVGLIDRREPPIQPMTNASWGSRKIDLASVRRPGRNSSVSTL